MFIFTGGDCASGGTAPVVPSIAGCDTTTYERFNAIDSTTTVLLRITCTRIDTVAVRDTVFVEVPCDPDTVFVEVFIEPDPDCVANCIDVNGLSHTRECLRACVPAR